MEFVQNFTSPDFQAKNFYFSGLFSCQSNSIYLHVGLINCGVRIKFDVLIGTTFVNFMFSSDFSGLLIVIKRISINVISHIVN